MYNLYTLTLCWRISASSCLPANEEQEREPSTTVEQSYHFERNQAGLMKFMHFPLGCRPLPAAGIIFK